MLFLAAVSLSAEKLSQQTTYDPSGTWDYEVETPDGNMTGELLNWSKANMKCLLRALHMETYQCLISLLKKWSWKVR